MGISVEHTAVASTIATNGWAVTSPLLPVPTIERCVRELAPAAERANDRGGVRNLFEAAPAVRELARSPEVRAVAEAVLGPRCFAVHAILFDKTPDANWKVVWHQDLTIAVQARANLPGFVAWSEKEGVVHVQPPIELLERMLAIRIHLDDCTADNGPVRVLDGSHRSGRLSVEATDQWRAQHPAVDCVAERGAILAFRPLILHASSMARLPAHRRVIHFDFATDELPPPLEWHHRIA